METKAKLKKAKKVDNNDLEFVIRYYDSFTQTLESLRKALDEIDERREAQDVSVHDGIGVVENKILTQGIEQGAVRSGIYGVLDLLYNPNSQEYLAIIKDGVIQRFDWAGNVLTSPKPPNKPFSKFIYCHAASYYICWTPNKSSFFLAKEDFTVVIDSVALLPIGTIIHSGRKNDDSFDFFVIAGASLNRYSYQSGSNLITLQDAMTLSDIEVDGGVIELTCFDDPKDDRKQWIYCTFGSNCTIIDVTGRVHGTKRNLHRHKITAITAIGASDFVVTGDEKGILKLWGLRWAYMSEIQAHTSRITHIIEHPNDRASVSFGKDQKLFVYSFDMLKEVETLNLPEVIDRIAVNKRRKGFMTQGPRKVVMWKMNILFEFRQNVSAPLRSVYMTTESDRTQRAVALCEDNAIHIMNPTTGLILTTALVLPTEPPLRSICYHRGPRVDTLFALVESESMYQLQQFDCHTNPAQLKETWEETKWSVGITCIALFDYNPKILLAEKVVGYSRRRKLMTTPTTFLICGRRDGCLCVVNMETGMMEYIIACHKTAVFHIEVDHEVNQAISLGGTPSLRLWKIGLNQDDLLIPLMDITWKLPIRLATFVRNVLAFALINSQYPEQNKIVVFNTSIGQRFDHPPEDGHKMEILSISVCRELVIFCTASLDGTIAIRGPKNELYRTIVLNMIPSYAAFVTKQGDIFLGIANDIYVVPAEKHLTVVPRARALGSNIPASETEPAIPLSLKAVRDPRGRSASGIFQPLPKVIPYEEPKDSQQARDLEALRLRDEDLWKIIEGNHPLEEIVPDFHNMTKQQWDEFGKSVYGDDGEDHKFFVSESRIASMLKMKEAMKDVNNFDNIN